MPAALERISDGDWDRVRLNTDTTARLLNPVVPQARVYNDANIVIGTGGVTVLPFNSERYDNGDLHSTSVNTGRLTAPITGLYAIGASVRMAPNATGIRTCTIRFNGTTEIVALSSVGSAAINADFNPLTQYQLLAGEYVEVTVFQNSGGNLNVTAGANFSPEFWMHRVAGYVNQGV